MSHKDKTRIETGWKNIDLITGGGLKRGNLYMVEGLEGCGKSSFGANIISHAVHKLGMPTVVFIPDMLGDKFIKRQISILSGIPTYDLSHDWGINAKNIVEFQNSVYLLSQCPLIVIDPTPPISEVESNIRYYFRHMNMPGLILFDDLWGIAHTTTNVHQSINNTLRILKSIATELNCVVIVLHTTGKGFVNRPGVHIPNYVDGIFGIGQQSNYSDGKLLSSTIRLYIETRDMDGLITMLDYDPQTGRILYSEINAENRYAS